MTTAVTSNLSVDSSLLSISVSGRFDFNLKDTFFAAYEEVLHPVREVTLDFKNLGYMDSSALGMLLYMNNSFCEKVEINIINCRPIIKELLLLARFDKHFTLK